jgi:hypothetical protein
MAQPMLGSHRNGQAPSHLFQKYLLCWEHEYIFSHNKVTSVKVSVLRLNILGIHFVPLLKETAQCCEFYDNVFETENSWELRTLCSPPYQLAPSPHALQGSNLHPITLLQGS